MTKEVSKFSPLDVINEKKSPREDSRPPGEDQLNLADTLPSIISESEVEELVMLREFYKRNSINPGQQEKLDVGFLYASPLLYEIDKNCWNCP